jgi:hypothetical protein
MGQQAVTLYWKCKTPEGWKRYPAAIGRNGKVRPRYAQVGNAQIGFPDGHYELRHYEGRKTKWVNVGDDASIAQAKQLQFAKTLRAVSAAEEAGTKILQLQIGWRWRARLTDTRIGKSQEARTGMPSHFAKL